MQKNNAATTSRNGHVQLTRRARIGTRKIRAYTSERTHRRIASMWKERHVLELEWCHARAVHEASLVRLFHLVIQLVAVRAVRRCSRCVLCIMWLRLGRCSVVICVRIHRLEGLLLFLRALTCLRLGGCTEDCRLDFFRLLLSWALQRRWIGK